MPAGAHDRGVRAHPHVADVAGRAPAPVQAAVDDDAAAYARAGLDDHEVLAAGPPARLARGHQVGVVLDEDRQVVAGGQVVGHRELVPAGHARGRHHAQARRVHRARDAGAHPPQGDRRGHVGGQQLVERVRDAVQGDLRAVVDLAAALLDDERRAAEVQEAEAYVVGAQVGDGQHAGAGESRSRRGRRPPREVPEPSSASRPASMSSSTRSDTLEAARPDKRARSARDSALPVATSLSRSPCAPCTGSRCFM